VEGEAAARAAFPCPGKKKKLNKIKKFETVKK